MNQEDKKILLTGVCYVHRLLEQRFRKPEKNYIEAIHPNFDINKVDFFRKDIEHRFLFTDFHGRISSIKTEANNLPELLSVYEPLCEKMYVVGATQIADLDVVNIMPEDYRKVSSFWYFLFNTNWNPTETRNWEAKRDQVLLALLNRFPSLKFIFYGWDMLEKFQGLGHGHIQYFGNVFSFVLQSKKKSSERKKKIQIIFRFGCHRLTPWRNGSASDSKSEGCVFESRRGQLIFCFDKH